VSAQKLNEMPQSNNSFFLSIVGKEMKLYYNIQSVEGKKAEKKVKIFFCGKGKILTMATEFLITRVGGGGGDF